MSAASLPTWQQSNASVTDRVDDLLNRMTIADKVGMMFHTMAFVVPQDQRVIPGIPSVREMVGDMRMRHLNVVGVASDARAFAAWHNEAQRLAMAVDLPIPITISTDPRHGRIDNPLAGTASVVFSRWPEPIGLAAIGDEDVVREFADIARQEYLAVGIRCALHPQIDLSTEPRWSRISATFGEDGDLTARLGRAYIEGFQTGEFGTDSVSTVTKHFPGGGPQKDGLDPHFANGREQVYPGRQWDYHLEPFRTAIAAGTRQMMPYYGMPIDTPYEAVGFGFNREIVTTLLQEELGFDGIVLSDWGLITDAPGFPARAWGVEQLSESDRMVRILEAGCDQFGGESRTDLLLELVNAGTVSEERLDASVRKLLAEKFLLGVFDAPFVDEDRALEIAGNPEFVAKGRAAQAASVTILTNGDEDAPVLPLRAASRFYLEGMEAAVVDGHGEAVDRPEDADVAIIRLQAPYEPKEGFEGLFHGGTLEFDADTIAHVQAVIATVPTVIDVFLERPAILTPFLDAAALVGTFGTDDDVLFAVLRNGGARGRLPFDLPRSMAAVESSREDVPFDTADPIFRFGHGLSLSTDSH